MIRPPNHSSGSPPAVAEFTRSARHGEWSHQGHGSFRWDRQNAEDATRAMIVSIFSDAEANLAEGSWF